MVALIREAPAPPGGGEGRGEGKPLLASLLASLLFLLLLCSCATTGARSDALCDFGDTAWSHDTTPLLIPRTKKPLGFARRTLVDGLWHGATVSGTLRNTRDAVLLDGEWWAHGLTVHADVDLSREPVLQLARELNFTPTLRATPGAALRALDAHRGEVLVAPSDAALQRVSPVTPPLAVSQCSELTLARRSDRDDARLAGVGGLPLVTLRANQPVPLMNEEGRLVALAAPELHARRVKTSADRVQLALLDDGLVWQGWANADDVTPAERPEPREASATVEQRAPRRNLVWRRCPEAVPLFVLERTDGEERALRVGTLDAHRDLATPFGVIEGRWFPVVPDERWFSLAPGVELVTSTDLSRCTSVSR